MKRSTGALRFGPWAATLLAALAFVAVQPAARSGGGEGVWNGAIPMMASPAPDGSCDDPSSRFGTSLLALSQQAAGLTGALALAESSDRPRRAAEAATGVRRLARRAQRAEGGQELAEVLNDLADGLQSYSAGNPAALASIQAASARNAVLRESYQSCETEDYRR